LASVIKLSPNNIVSFNSSNFFSIRYKYLVNN
jgi:hypothetical protein